MSTFCEQFRTDSKVFVSVSYCSCGNYYTLGIISLKELGIVDMYSVLFSNWIFILFNLFYLDFL